MDLAERIATLRRVNDLSARQLAALVDVAPTTITRIESRSVCPSFDLAQEILAVLGESIVSVAAADTAAIAAARLALDPAQGIVPTDDVESWLRRWARIGLIDKRGLVVPGREPDLCRLAGRAARLTRRAGAVDFDHGVTAQEIASALSAGGIGYAVTGDAGANAYRSGAGEVWPVVYVDDLDRAAEVVGLFRKAPGAFGMRVTLIPFDGVCEIGRRTFDGVVFAARDQVVIDAYGGVDRMPEHADILLGLRD